jgi:RNA polymerase sigma factor (sigma-70 family)
MPAFRASRLRYPVDAGFVDWRVEVLRKLEPDIVGISNQYRDGINGMDADDIAQELRLKLWKVIERFDPSRSSIRTWSVRVLNNARINLYVAQNAFKRRIDLLPEDFDVYITADNGKQSFIFDPENDD